jgi:glycosyltransferase involved in cell wall biosynthesis
MNPILSIVVMTYNQHQYVNEALKSVYSQKIKVPFEVLLSDDCSTDGTQDILREWNERFPNITRLILHKHNLGGHGVANLNEAIEGCRGRYIAFLEGDDYWTSNHKIQRQLDVLESDEAITACAHETMVLRRDGQLQPLNHGHPDGVQDLRYLLEYGFPHINSLVVRSASLSNRSVSLRSLPMGDWPIIIQCAMDGKIISLPDSKWSVYRVQGQGSWNARKLVYRTLGEICAFETFKLCLPTHYKFSLNKQILRRRWWIAEDYLRQRERILALHTALPGFLLWCVFRHVPFRALVKFGIHFLIGKSVQGDRVHG